MCARQSRRQKQCVAAVQECTVLGCASSEKRRSPSRSLRTSEICRLGKSRGPTADSSLSRRPTQVTPGYSDTNTNQTKLEFANLGFIRKVKTGRKVRSSYVSNNTTTTQQYKIPYTRRLAAACDGMYRVPETALFRPPPGACTPLLLLT